MKNLRKGEMEMADKSINIDVQVGIDLFLKKFFADNNISASTNGPIDVFSIATALGFGVYPADMEANVEGAIIVDETKESVAGTAFNKVILYEVNNALKHVSFVVAHELAHYITEKLLDPNDKAIVEHREHKGSNPRNAYEQLIDYMAASILVPYDSAISYIKEHNLSIENISEYKYLKEMSDYFDVSFEMMSRRAEEIRNGQQYRTAHCIGP